MHTHLSLLLDTAKSAGADHVTVICEKQNSTSVSVRNRQVEASEQSITQAYGLEVICDHKRASVMFSGEMPDITTMTERAIAMAKASPPDETAVIATKEQYAHNYLDLDTYDTSGIEQTTPERLLDTANQTHDVIMDHVGILQAETGSSSISYDVAMLTSNGFEGTYRNTQFSVYGTAYTGKSTKMERDYAHSYARHKSDVHTPEFIGKLAAERAVSRLNPQRIKSGTYPVIFDRRISSSLVGHILNAANGKAIVRKSSWLLRSMNQQILPTGVSVIDDPTVPRRLGARPFDDEGLACTRLDLIHDGYLRDWLLDLGTAQHLGLSSNGRAGRASAGTPSPVSMAAYLTPGSQTPAALVDDIQQGLYITSLIGSSVNPTTGAYSRGASGFWIENGKITYPVNEITIAGNLVEMLPTLDVANDLIFESSTNAPTVRIQSMTVAGQS